MCLCVCNTVMLFHLFGKNIPPSNTGTVAAQSPERGGIQDGLMLIGMPFEREKMKQRWSGHYAAES